MVMVGGSIHPAIYHGVEEEVGSRVTHIKKEEELKYFFGVVKLGELKFCLWSKMRSWDAGLKLGELEFHFEKKLKVHKSWSLVWSN